MMESESVQQTCERHGKYVSEVTIIFGTKFQSSCPDCESEFANARKVNDQVSQIHKLNIIDAGVQLRIGKLFLGYTFDDYRAITENQQLALKVAKSTVDSFSSIFDRGVSILFFGNSGTGKTMLATIMATTLMVNGVQVVYKTIQKAIRTIRSTFNGHGNEQSEIDKLANCEMLILEEVGVQLGTPYEISILHEIIDERYKEKRPTLLTSNLDLDGVSSYLGDRVMRRLEDSSGIIVPFSWEKFSIKSK